MARTPAEAVAEYESTLREWTALNRRFETPELNPSHGTSKANRLAKRMGAMEALLGAEPAFRDRLLALLDDPEPGVRTHAAMFALAWDAPRAQRVLMEVEQLPGLVSLGARQILKRYRERPVLGRPADLNLSEKTPPTLPPDLERLFDDIWMFHGAARNGGFLLAFATAGHLGNRVRQAFFDMGSPEVAEVIAAACRLFPDGLIPAYESTRVRLIDDVIDAEQLEALGDAYDRLIPSDAVLESRMERLVDLGGR